MKTNFFSLKKVFVFITILLSLGLSRISANDSNTYLLDLKDGSQIKLSFKNLLGDLSVDYTTGSITAYTTNGDSILDILGSTLIYDAGTDVKVNERSNASLSIYPNPSDGNFYLEANLTATSNVYLQIFALNGQMVNNVQLANQPTGTLNYQFNQNLKTGIYVLRLKTENSVMSQKIIIK
jgi:hypothetical protein